MLDLLVIGAGLSGLMAAQTVARAGHTVRIVSKGMNALHWSPGTVDVLGYLPGSSDTVQQPLAAIDELLESWPGHPYGHLGAAKIRDSLDHFQALTAEIGLPYYGATTPGENLLLPSPAGAARPVYLAPAAQHAGNLGHPEPLLIVGFHGLRDFYPELIAENLRKQGYVARAAYLPVALITDRNDFNTVQLAHSLQSALRSEKLGQALRGLVRSGERIGLPAILGLEEHATVMQVLETTAGATVFEIPTLPPSVPGIRLFHALRAHLRVLGVRLEAGMTAIQAEMESGTPGRIEWIATETSARPLKHRAKQFVLATGGILGGGFDSNYAGRVWETIFDLPLTTPQKRSQWFRAGFLAPEGHPVFQGGVAVNSRFQPVDGKGQTLYANLRAAGNILAYADPLVERSLEGLTIVTGQAAGTAVNASLEQDREEMIAG